MQEELASGRGTFFSAVLQNMSPASSDPLEPLQNGASLSRYWERFGDFAGQRDLGAIAHGLAQVMDNLQAGRTQQASDHAAFLAVCVEQMSMDNGRSELGFQLRTHRAQCSRHAARAIRYHPNEERGTEEILLCDRSWGGGGGAGVKARRPPRKKTGQ